MTHDLSATAAVIHTSGTSSAPRPVELTYGNFLWSALGSAVALGVVRPRVLVRDRFLVTDDVHTVGVFLAQARVGLDRRLDAARREGIPPGWLR